MKTRAFWFTVLSWSVPFGSAPALAGDAGPPELLWFRQIDASLTDVAASVKEVGDGGFVVAGYSERAPSQGRTDYLLRLSASGDVVWDATFAAGRGDRLFVVEVIEDGFIVAGRAASCPEVASCAHLTKVGRNGRTVWEKGIPNGLFAVTPRRSGGAVDVTTAAHGGFVYVGETELGGVAKVFVSGLDAAGEREWETLVDEGTDVEACCIERITGGGYLVGGAAGGQLVVTRLGAGGGIAWQRTYGAAMSGPLKRMRSIEELAEGFVFAGTANLAGHLFRADSAGEVQWHTELDTADFPFEARRLADGGYAVVANAETGALLFKVDESGEVAWETVFGENDGTQVLSFEVTSEGGYIVAGVTYTGRDRDLFVARLSPTGVGRFVRGDSNDDGRVDLGDAVFSLGRLFAGANGEPGCLQAADADDDGEINLTDPVFLLQHLFQGGPQPPAPFESCGIDRTLDALGCAGAVSCGVSVE